MEPLQSSTISIILTSSHPLRPVLWSDAAGVRPGPGAIELRVPVQRPQFLETNLPHGPIKKKTVDMSIVAIHAEILNAHEENAFSGWWWPLRVKRIRPRRHRIQQDGNVGAPPQRQHVQIKASTAQHGHFKGELVETFEHPLVETITAAKGRWRSPDLPGSKDRACRPLDPIGVRQAKRVSAARGGEDLSGLTSPP